MSRVSRVLALGVLLVVVAGCGEKNVEVPDLVRACEECHSQGSATVPGWPPLNSMSAADIEAKLRGYREQLVPESRMSDVAHNFTDEEIRALASYYGGTTR